VLGFHTNREDGVQMANPDRTPVIVGIGLSDLPIAPDLGIIEHNALASHRAIADSGVDKASIDGYISGNRNGLLIPEMAEYIGINYRYLDGTYVGGSSWIYHIQHAAAAIQAGYCETVLISYGSNTLSSVGRAIGTGAQDIAGAPAREGQQYEAPYGNSLVGAYAMAAKRHMHEYGTTSEQLAEIAVGVREFAAFNPSAMYRTPLTIEDVINSRMIADPLHKFDCCSTTDGGGAIVMTTESRARDLPNRPVYILGASTSQTHWNISQMPDFTSTGAAAAGLDAFAQAGLRPSDVKLAMLYDSFTITCLLLLEGLGFCAPGEGGSFVAEGHLRKGARLPMNTDGGALSAYHPGNRGIFLILESVRQLRGDAGEVQVPDCDIALAAGSGGWMSAIGVALLGTQAAA
jgi:acetyl-CoA acetyltransferase